VRAIRGRYVRGWWRRNEALSWTCDVSSAQTVGNIHTPYTPTPFPASQNISYYNHRTAMRFGIHDLQDHLDSSDDDDNPQFNASTSFSSSSSNYSSPSTSDEDELGESSFLNDFLGRPGGSSTPNDKSLKNTGRGKRVGEQPIRRTERRVSSGRYGLNVRRLASDVESENVRITDQ
jgi:hypothetical protein